MKNLTIVIPVYNPQVEKLEKAINSALNVQDATIIVVDDFSNQHNTDYFNYLYKLEAKGIKVVRNMFNKGPVFNSLYALSLAETKYVRKLDPDDVLIYKNINKIDFSVDAAILITKYKNSFRFNSSRLFNGCIIYNSEIFKKEYGNFKEYLSTKEQSSKKLFFDDVTIPTHIINNHKNEIIIIRKPCYFYRGPSSSSAKKIFQEREQWQEEFKNYLRYNIKETAWENKLANKTCNDLIIFNKILHPNEKHETYRNFPIDKRTRMFLKLPTNIINLIRLFIF